MSTTPNANQSVLSGDGAVSPAPGLFHITKAGAAALTLALPTVDGQKLGFIDETGHAHTIVCGGSPANGLNSTHGTLTFGGTVGDSCEIVSRNGLWWTLSLNGVTAS